MRCFCSTANLKLILFVAFILSYRCLFAQQATGSSKISISFSNESIETCLIKLQETNHVLLSFDPDLFPKDKLINKVFINATVPKILSYLLFKTQLTYKLIGNEFVIIPAEKKSITIDGHIKDEDTGEDVIAAVVYLPQLNQTVLSNNYGFYSITLPAGTYDINVFHLNYISKVIQKSLRRSATVNIYLRGKTNMLNEINISSSNGDSVLDENLQSQKSLAIEKSKKQPYYRGETDIVKALQAQGGINGLTEGSSDLFVRGGNKDQNLILFDEAIVYNPAHLFGLVSVFNPDAIKDVQVYKDALPANYGGRLSSVIDSRMADGDNQNFHIKGGISLLSARLAAEGPIVKNKASFLFAYRKGLWDLMPKNYQLFGLNANYYDMNFKLNYVINPNNRIYYSIYVGSDHLSAINSYANDWGNQTSTIRWNHLFNSKLFFNLSAVYSNYQNSLDINADTVSEKYKWQTGIQDKSIKGDFTYYRDGNNEIKFGFNAILHLFKPGESPQKDSLSNIPRAKAVEYAIYLSHQYSPFKAINILYGLRTTLFQNIQTSKLYVLDDYYKTITTITNLDGNYQSFLRFEPRLEFHYKINTRQELHASYGRSYQFIQLVQNDELAFSSLETWIPSSPNIDPQKSDIWSLGYFANIKSFSFNINGYLKKLYNQLDLIDHAQIILNPVIENQLRPGNTDAYGVEFSVSKNIGRLNGNINYTWSRVFRRIAGIENGNSYPANYDIPNNLKVVMGYRISNTLSFNSFFNYSSGRPVTLPVGFYSENGTNVPIFEDRNQSRFPDYSRLDIAINYEAHKLWNKKHQFINSLSLGLYNVYSRKNPLFYGINQNITSTGYGYIQSFSGISPFIAYSFKY